MLLHGLAAIKYMQPAWNKLQAYLSIMLEYVRGLIESYQMTFDEMPVGGILYQILTIYVTNVLLLSVQYNKLTQNMELLE